MTPKELVTRFFQAGYTEKDYDFVLQSMADDYVDHSPAGARSNRDAVSILNIVAQRFSGLTAQVLDCFAEDGMVATRVRFTGTAAGGVSVTFEALENFLVVGGKIVESWGYWPDEEIARQCSSAQRG